MDREEENRRRERGMRKKEKKGMRKKEEKRKEHQNRM
jgi:hypothetical protein